MNSSNHSGRSRKRSSASRLSSLFLFWFWASRDCTSFLELVRQFALGLDLLKTNPAMSMLKMNCYPNWRTTREQQEVRNCPFCIKLSSPLWSTVVFDRRPTHRKIRGLRRLFQAIEQQAFLPVIALSRINLDRERTLVLLRLFALLHPLWCFWISAKFPPVLLSSNPFFLLSTCIDAPESTTNSRSSGDFEAGAAIALFQ